MISKSSEEYIKNMYILKKQKGNIRVTDIAQKMKCSKPSVNKAINILKEEKLINYETYGTIELTGQGEDLAKKILEAYDITYYIICQVKCLYITKNRFSFKLTKTIFLFKIAFLIYFYNQSNHLS